MGYSSTAEPLKYIMPTTPSKKRSRTSPTSSGNAKKGPKRKKNVNIEAKDSLSIESFLLPIKPHSLSINPGWQKDTNNISPVNSSSCSLDSSNDFLSGTDKDKTTLNIASELPGGVEVNLDDLPPEEKLKLKSMGEAYLISAQSLLVIFERIRFLEG